MSKRDIKAKRWLRKEMKRKYRSAWEWAKSTTGIIKAIATPSSVPADKPLRFLTQYRKFGDGREQLRDGVPDFRGGSAVMWGDWFDVRGGERVQG